MAKHRSKAIILASVFSLASLFSHAQACVPTAGVSCTPNIGLYIPDFHYPDWNIPLNYNWLILDNLAKNGGLLPANPLPIIHGGTGCTTIACVLATLGAAPAFTLTTNNTSGAATYTGNVLNIPQYSGGGGGFTAAGDLSGNSTSQTVVGIQGHALAAPSTAAYIHWSGSVWEYLNPSGAGTVTTSGSPVSPNVSCFSAATTIGPCTSANIQTAIGGSVYDTSGAASGLLSSANTWTAANTFSNATFKLSGLAGLPSSGNYCLHVSSTGAVGAATFDCGSGGSSFITSLTTLGSSGAATVLSGVLNIPQYTSGSSSYPGVTADGSNGLIITGNAQTATLKVGSGGTPTLINVTSMTVAALQLLTGNTLGDERLVNNAASAFDCSVGAGSVQHWCYYNGTVWVTANASSGSMVYPTAGLPVSTGAAWNSSVTTDATTGVLYDTAGTVAFAATLPATALPAQATIVSGGAVSVAANNTYVICTTTCTVTPLAPAAGNQLCVRNAPGSATVITMAALGSGNYYELTTHAGWGTANHTIVSSGAATDSVCLVGYDANHYIMLASVNSWTD